MLWFTMSHISKAFMFTTSQVNLISCAVEIWGPIRASGIYLTLIMSVGKPLGEPQFSTSNPGLLIRPSVVTDPPLNVPVGQINLACVWGIRGQWNGVTCQNKITTLSNQGGIKNIKSIENIKKDAQINIKKKLFKNETYCCFQRFH